MHTMRTKRGYDDSIILGIRISREIKRTGGGGGGEGEGGFFVRSKRVVDESWRRNDRNDRVERNFARNTRRNSVLRSRKRSTAA